MKAPWRTASLPGEEASVREQVRDQRRREPEHGHVGAELLVADEHARTPADEDGVDEGEVRAPITMKSASTHCEAGAKSSAERGSVPKPPVGRVENA